MPPSFARPVQHTIAIAQVDQILQGARTRGLDCDALLRRAGIAPTLLGSNLARVTQAQYATLVVQLTRRMRDELWGLAGRPVPLGTFATGCRMLVRCETLGEALRQGARYAHQVLPDIGVHVQRHGGLVTLRIDTRQPPSAPLEYAQRSFMFFAFGVACWLVARRIPLQEVVYDRAVNVQRSEASRLFQAPVSAGRDWMGLRFESRWLDLPVVQSTESVEGFLRSVPGDLLVRYRDHTSLTERIRRVLRRHLHEELPSLEQVSGSLAMTPQTLRRRLQREGQGFQAIKDSLRRDVAVEYLSRPDLTLIEIAERLGYSEASTFHRAFKAWTGLAPGAYRERYLARAQDAAAPSAEPQLSH
ncbi:AraC family transcriptional regulator [Pseudacidovorax sp. NFM-22]|uniref:AraC family transcriptional regulator n=1 Tax=Pseudacidovorax sp. NFM-22 TaxID=2744469 RepID=UPI001F16DBD1|nr:AraC family transcriptional regulator [Pseudacidovorax sp. NFM-22]